MRKKNILYIVISFEEGQASYQEIDYVVGPYLKYNQTYLKQLLTQEKTLLKKIPITHQVKRQEKEKINFYVIRNHQKSQLMAFL